eukprot:m.631064 g.631064  ORF g.631064 m.631064 type:complete len:95 (-) comp22570_c0_seq3:17-301(-)
MSHQGPDMASLESMASSAVFPDISKIGSPAIHVGEDDFSVRNILQAITGPIISFYCFHLSLAFLFFFNILVLSHFAPPISYHVLRSQSFEAVQL